MSFQDSVRHALSNYASALGRAARAESWWFSLFALLGVLAASVVNAVVGIGFLSLLVFLGLIVPSVATTIRRLHHTDRSWWMHLVSFILLLVFCVSQGTHGPNRYGAAPAGPA